MPQPLMLKKMKLNGSMKTYLQDLLEITPKERKKERKDVLFIIGDWTAKVESQDILGVTGKSDLGLQN